MPDLELERVLCMILQEGSGVLHLHPHDSGETIQRLQQTFCEGFRRQYGLTLTSVIDDEFSAQPVLKFYVEGDGEE